MYISFKLLAFIASIIFIFYLFKIDNNEDFKWGICIILAIIITVSIMIISNNIDGIYIDFKVIKNFKII